MDLCSRVRFLSLWRRDDNAYPRLEQVLPDLVAGGLNIVLTVMHPAAASVDVLR